MPRTTERQHGGNQIDAAMIFARADLVKVRRTLRLHLARGSPSPNQSQQARSLSEPVLSKRSARVQCSERKAVAAQAEELAIPIPLPLNTSYELMPGMTTTILVTGAAMLVL